MDKEQYVSYLSTIDVAVFPPIYSTAIGNLTWLLHLDISVFVSDESQFAEIFRRNGCKYCSINSIEIVSFDEFVSTQISDELKQKYGNIKSRKDVCTAWKQYLETLK